uniref:SJCHGC02972 protein n=1 Tax=Schistosoma japonicum TaxID=6182 RepID=Q5DGN6_SCHJA|nr:SJCHGC02972 protein [Schistosoma japonicum]
MSVSRKGMVIIGINMVNKPDNNCDMTIVFADGKYEVSKDGDGTIVDEKVILKKVIPGSNISNSIYFIFTPRTTCQEHTSEDACITKTRGELNCDWCGECQTCVLKESPCNCLDQTETTESQPQKIESSINYHIVLGFALIVLFIFGMIACTLKILNQQFDCQPCMT